MRHLTVCGTHGSIRVEEDTNAAFVDFGDSSPYEWVREQEHYADVENRQLGALRLGPEQFERLQRETHLDSIAVPAIGCQRDRTEANALRCPKYAWACAGKLEGCQATEANHRRDDRLPPAIDGSVSYEFDGNRLILPDSVVEAWQRYDPAIRGQVDAITHDIAQKTGRSFHITGEDGFNVAAVIVTTTAPLPTPASPDKPGKP
jgi:hypothetical protein